MAVALSKCSKTVTQLRQAYPTLETNLKGGGDLMTEFLKRSSERLDNAWRRCKKLTGTLVTLKRLASVQEQGCSTTIVRILLGNIHKLPAVNVLLLSCDISDHSRAETKWSILSTFYDRGFILADPDLLHQTSRCHRLRLRTPCHRQTAAPSLRQMVAKRTRWMTF